MGVGWCVGGGRLVFGIRVGSKGNVRGGMDRVPWGVGMKLG